MATLFKAIWASCGPGGSRGRVSYLLSDQALFWREMDLQLSDPWDRAALTLCYS